MLYTQIIDIVTLVVISIWLIRSYKNRELGGGFFISSILFVLYILPLALDWFYELADYSYSGWWGFMAPRRDFLTNFVYDVTFIYLFYVLSISNRKNVVVKKLSRSQSKRIQLLLIFFSILPCIAVVLLLRRIEMLYSFGWRELDLFPTAGSYSTIEKFTYIGVSSSVLLLFNQIKRSRILIPFAIVTLLMNICIQGKRAILFYAIINIIIVIYLRAKESIVQSKGINIKAFLIVLIGIAFSYLMVNITLTTKLERGYNPADTSAMYTTTRIDFLRDDRVRLAIYSRLHPNEVKILNYPTQTLWADVFSFIPLNYISSICGIQEYSYQTYFTHALEKKPPGKNVDVENCSYMTVCCIAEIISNFGLFIAFFLIPYICIQVAKLSDKYPYPINALILFAFVSVNLFDFTYMAYLIELVIVLCFILKLSLKH